MDSLCYNSIITFYRNEKTKSVLTAHLFDFAANPNKAYPKSCGKLQTLKDAQTKYNENLEKQRADKEEQLRQSMKNERCELISKYEKCSSPVYYLFEGLGYKTTPTKWNTGNRAHKLKCIRYTPNHIKQLFKNEDCELLIEYKNQKAKLKYLYKGKEYEVTFNDWKFFNKRPHLHDV